MAHSCRHQMLLRNCATSAARPQRLLPTAGSKQQAKRRRGPPETKRAAPPRDSQNIAPTLAPETLALRAHHSVFYSSKLSANKSKYCFLAPPRPQRRVLPAHLSNLPKSPVQELQQTQEQHARPCAHTNRRPVVRRHSLIADALFANSANIHHQTMKQHNQQLAQEDAMLLMRMRSRQMSMKWDTAYSSPECLVSDDQTFVRFHPDSAHCTTVCLAEQPLHKNVNYFYWEIQVLIQAYGTSVMFGVCTKRQQLQRAGYYNLIGIDEHGWCMSHKGLVWHAGVNRPYADPFPAGRPVTVGLKYDALSGQLSYYVDGRSLGVAFFGLNQIHEDLYPCVGSTAKNTVMVLAGAYYGHESLMDRACFNILRHSSNHAQLIEYLERSYKLPKALLDKLKNLERDGRQEVQASHLALYSTRNLLQLVPDQAVQLQAPLVEHVHMQYQH